MTKLKKKTQSVSDVKKGLLRRQETAGGIAKSTTKKVSNKKLQELIKWNPHKNQKKILKSNKTEIIIAAGRGFGKTALCAYICLRELLKDGKQILLVAPTYNLNDRVLEYLEKWITISFPNLLSGFSKRVPQSVTTPWGSRIECRSAEAPKGMLGKRFDLVVVDEAAKIPRKVWETYIYPTTQITGGKIIYISTPWGKNWFYETWVRTGGFQFRSIDNPYYRKKDWDNAKEVLPEATFEQENEAKFLSDAASVFRGVDKIVVDGSERDVVPGHRYLMGVDLGRSRDFTVLTVVDQNTHGAVFIDRFKTVDYNFQKKRIIATANRYNQARIIIDSNTIGDPISDDIKRSSNLVIDEFKFAGGKSTNKKELIEKLSIYIEQGKITIPKNRYLIDELKSYGYEMTEAGRIKYSAPQGLHDDCVISLALAVWELRGKPNKETLLQKEIKNAHQRSRRQRSYI